MSVVLRRRLGASIIKCCYRKENIAQPDEYGGGGGGDVRTGVLSFIRISHHTYDTNHVYNVITRVTSCQH